MSINLNNVFRITDVVAKFDSYDFFGTTINVHDIFGCTDDIQAIVSRHVETIVKLVNMGVKPDFTVGLDASGF